jgi:hypothetical protein
VLCLVGAAKRRRWLACEAGQVDDEVVSELGSTRDNEEVVLCCLFVCQVMMIKDDADDGNCLLRLPSR